MSGLGMTRDETPSAGGVKLRLSDALKQAQTLYNSGEFDRAGRIARAIVERHPQHAPAWTILAGIAEKRGDRERAVEILNGALSGTGTDALLLMNMCRVLRVLGRLDAARDAGERAVRIGTVPEALVDLADVHYALGESTRALELFERAVALRPNLARAHMGLAQGLLMRGEFNAGWAEYEWRYRLANTKDALPKFKQPQWNGMPLKSSRLLVVAEQGYGDCFQFARYLPAVCARVGTVYLGAGLEITPVLKSVQGNFWCFDRWEHIPPFEFQITLSSLPLVFGTTLETIPAAVPYLHADVRKTAQWRERLLQAAQGRKSVGFVWQGRPTHPNDRNRSVGLGALTRLLEDERLLPVSLQVGAGREQLAQHPARSRVLDAAADLNDFGDTAALIAALDCVVTIDSAIAHLTGGLGRPGFVMLPKGGEWRWLEGRSDTPWYPTLSLVRQRRAGDWHDVTARVVEHLHV